MTDYIILFGATVLAVLAVGFFGKWIGKRSIDLISSFTGAFVIGIIVFHMLPEVYSELPPHTIGLCVMAGLLIQSVLDFFTKGIDHGHTHTPSCTHGRGHDDDGNMPLTVAMFVSLSLHTFIESLPILSGGHIHEHEHVHHGLEIAGVSPLLAGIALHTVPMAMVLYIFLLRVVKKRSTALLLMAVFGLAGPLGMFAGQHISWLSEYYFQLLAVVGGILLHVSAVMLFDCDMAVYGKIKKLAVIVLGFAGAMILTS